jgi:hypothetical protein
MLHTCNDTWHFVVCRSSNICEVEKSKKINYKVVENKLKINQNLCKLVEM